MVSQLSIFLKSAKQVLSLVTNLNHFERLKFGSIFRKKLSRGAKGIINARERFKFQLFQTQ
jgi:hypothetical protein